MRAEAGDRIVIPAHLTDDPARDGEIMEVHGPDGQPPFLVRWSDNGHESLIFPGPDARIAEVEPMVPNAGAEPA